MSRILILGSTGFMGRNVAEYFSTRGHEVITHGLTRRADIQEDLLKPKAVDYTDIDVVVQCAAATSGCKDTLEDPALHIANNAVMNSYVLKECAQAKVKHVIFPSCSVMYHSNHIPHKETDFDANKPLNPAYLGFASTKLYCEKLCEFYAGISDTKFTVIRNTNFYGPHDKYDLKKSHVFGASVTKVMNAFDKVSVWGAGEEKRDFVYIEDFCDFVQAAIDGQKEKYALYHCGSGIATSVNMLVKTMIEASGKKLTVEHDMASPTIPTSLCLNYDKAYEELGWHPKTSLKDGVAKALDWWERDKNLHDYELKKSYGEHLVLLGRSAPYIEKVMNVISLYQAHTGYDRLDSFDKAKAEGFKNALVKTGNKNINIATINSTLQKILLLKEFFAWIDMDKEDVDALDIVKDFGTSYRTQNKVMEAFSKAIS